MSISFTPSQLILITGCCTESEFIRGAEYTSSERQALEEMFNEPKAEYPNLFNADGSVRHVTASERQLEMQLWREADRARTERFESSVILVDRAYARFRKEFLYYTAGRCKLSVVREYHRYLIDALAPFTLKVEGF